jgi:hypothetical protein
LENAFQPELWRDLYVMLGTSSAALVGLLFVVTSLHLDQIVNNAVFRLRARNNTLHLLIMLVEAAMILTPQPVATLGAELVAVNLFGLRLPLSFAYKYFHQNKGNRSGFPIYPFVTYTASYLLGIAGGAGLIEHANWGMYLVAISYVTILVAVALNAWTIMLGVGQTETTTKAN